MYSEVCTRSVPLKGTRSDCSCEPLHLAPMTYTVNSQSEVPLEFYNLTIHNICANITSLKLQKYIVWFRLYWYIQCAILRSLVQEERWRWY